VEILILDHGSELYIDGKSDRLLASSASLAAHFCGKRTSFWGGARARALCLISVQGCRIKRSAGRTRPGIREPRKRLHLAVRLVSSNSLRHRQHYWLLKKALPAILPERPPPKRLRASRHCWKICRRIAVGSHRCLALLIPRRKALLDAPLVILDTFRSPVFNQSPRHGASRESNTRRTHR
jgi:hypothetical protein